MRINYDISVNYYIDTNIIKAINSIKGNYLNTNCIDWYDNGKKMRDRSYVNGYLSGKYREWYYGGKLAMLCYYKDNKLEGDYKLYNRDGSIDEHKIYKNDEIVRHEIV